LPIINRNFAFKNGKGLKKALPLTETLRKSANFPMKISKKAALKAWLPFQRDYGYR
jgi:hypothetical protein